MDRLTALVEGRRLLALAKSEKLKGFRLKIWENMGWHYKIVRKHCSIHQDDRTGKYDAYMSQDGIGAYAAWCCHKSYATPRKAYEAALNKAYLDIHEQQMIISELEKAL
jgi:hypothetical protein